MSLHRLQDINALADPLKQFEATFYIAVPPRNPFDASLTNQLELRAQTFSFPTIKGDVTEVTWSGHKRTYAGKQTREGEWKVTFTEVWSGQVIDGFKKWMNQYHDFVGGTISLFDEYKTTIKVNLLNPDLYDPKPEGAVEKSLTLYRCWPKEVSVPEVNPSSSEPVNINVTLSYDYFIMGSEEEAAHASA